MEQNKTAKYFKYAIGEIILVVIGILIALQINNWNENRKLRSVEHAMLLNIKNNLVESKSTLNRIIKRHELQIKHYKHTIYYIDQDLPYNTELDSAFVDISTWGSPFLTYIDYETLKTKGLDIIQNDSIKKGITYIYEYAFYWLVEDYDRMEWARAENVTIPFSEKHIRYNIDNNLATPNDFEALKMNDEFINILYNNIRFRESGIEGCQRIIREMEEVIKMINKELKQHD
jgi:hypothetical protein